MTKLNCWITLCSLKSFDQSKLPHFEVHSVLLWRITIYLPWKKSYKKQTDKRGASYSTIAVYKEIKVQKFAAVAAASCRHTCNNRTKLLYTELWCDIPITRKILSAVDDAKLFYVMMIFHENLKRAFYMMHFCPILYGFTVC